MFHLYSKCYRKIYGLLLLPLVLMLVKESARSQDFGDTDGGTTAFPSVQIPPSPEVSSINKFIDIPVSYYSGMANVNIPIYTITARDISLPIAMKYHGRGFQVNEIASNIGLGWSLEAGGSISRVINRYPDESVNPDYRRIFSERSDIPNFIESIAPDNEREGLEQIYRNLYETEPDIFYLNYPGYGGKLYLDGNGNYQSIPYAAISVRRHANNESDGYTVTDLNGFEYKFEEVEKQDASSTAGGSLDPWIIDFSNLESTYHLTSITSPKGGTMTFQYDTYSYSYYTDFNQSSQRQGNVGQIQNTISWAKVDITQGKRISKIISSDGYEVNFIYNEDHRSDLPDNAPSGLEAGKLDKIEVNYFNEEITSFDLVHDYTLGTSFGRPAAPSDLDIAASQKRLMLMEIQKAGDEPYMFTYDSRQLPTRFSYSRDFWGYYNGADNNTLIPADHPDPAQRGLDDYIPGGDRDINEDYLYANMLRKITYPNKGETSFEYEPNSIVFSPDGENCLEQFVPRQSEYNSTSSGEEFDVVEETFTIPANAVNIEFYYYTNAEYPTGWLDVIHGESHSEALISWVDEDGEDVSWPLEGNGNKYVADPVIPLVAGREYTVKIRTWGLTDVRNEDQEFIPASYTVRFEWDDVNVLCDFTDEVVLGMGGSRIKSIVHIPLPGKTNFSGGPLTTQYFYSSPIYQLPQFFHRTKYWDTSSGSAVLVTASAKRSHPILSANTLFNNSIIYNRVTVQHGTRNDFLLDVSEGDEGSEDDPVLDGEEEDTFEYPDFLSTDNGRSVYIYDHTKDNLRIDTEFGFGLAEDYSWQRGQLIGERHYRYDFELDRYQLVSYKTYDYKTTPSLSRSIWGFKVYVTEPYLRGDDNGNWPEFKSQYRLIDYRLRSEWYRMTSSTERQYFYDGLNLTGSKLVTTDYEYNLTNLLPKKVTTRSEDRTVENITKYALDYSSPPSTIDNAVVENTIILTRGNIVLNEDEPAGTNQKVISSTVLDYDGPNAIAGYKLESAQPIGILDFPVHQKNGSGKYTTLIPGGNSTGLYELKQQYTYSPSNKILSVQDVDQGTYQYYDYGYNDNYVIATSTGTRPGTLFYEGFEENGLDSNNSKSGIKVNNGSNYTISTAHVPPFWESSLKMSYWYQTSDGEWHFSGELDFNRNIQSPPLTSIDEVRVYPAGALVNTYSYKPGVGVISVSDPNGYTQHYDYENSSNRLKTVLDDNRNLRQRYQYNFAK